MFAKLTSFDQMKEPDPNRELIGPTHLTWVAVSAAATRFTKDDAQTLISELISKQPGHIYRAIRDENGESDQPSNCVNNFLVEKI